MENKFNANGQVIFIEPTWVKGETYVFNITIVEIKDLISTLEKTTSKEIDVEIKTEENNISKNIINTLKGKDITLKISKYDNNNVKYIWSINGKNIKEEFDFNTLVKFETNNENKINELTNFAESIYINYSHEGKLPKDTKFKAYVGNKYKENTILNLYYYNEKKNTLELKKEGLLVKNGFVEYQIEHCSEYVLTQAIFNNKTIDIKTLVIIIESVLILGLSSYIVYIKFFKNRYNL